MNKQLLRISRLTDKDHLKILGLMSGTSLDGLDIALCKCTEDQVQVEAFRTYNYPDEFRRRIFSVQSKPTIDLDVLCRLNREIAEVCADFVQQFLSEINTSAEDIDLIGSHGQTVYHIPEGNRSSTLQIGDGDQLAVKTGIPVIFDFRQKHIAAGGEGAPLVALMDEALFRHESKNRVLLNLGGIANLTWLPSKQTGGEIISTDTGPANTLINEACALYFDQPFDESGAIAKRGTVHSELVKYLLLEPFFQKPIPKTTGQETFNLDLVKELMNGYQIELTPEDLIASLTELTVKSVQRALESITGEEYELYVSGGGVHNQAIMDGFRTKLGSAEVLNFEVLGMHPDAKEAALMAFLANALVHGQSFSINGTDTVLGKVSLP